MRLIIIAFFSLFSLGATAQGIDFFEGSWEEAIEAAKKQDKIIFVDAYAVWCGPCKRMSKNVFTDRSVGDFYNKNFINLKLDMERGEGLEFRRKYPVSAFPTLFYIDYTGEVVQKIRGALQVPAFIKAGKAALGKIDRSGVFAEAYEKGDRSPELIYSYVKALNQAGKPSIKITNDYLRSQDDLTSEENLKVIFEGAVEADSRIFGLLIDHQKAVENIFSRQLVEERILQACEATSLKAIEFRSERLLEEAIGKAMKHAPVYGKAFAAQAKMRYYKDTKDPKAYTDACEDYVKTLEKEDRQTHFLLASELAKLFSSEPKAMKLAEKLAGHAADGSDNYSYYLNYSSILLFNGKKSKALEAAKMAHELARAAQNFRDIKRVEKYLEQFE
jgi:thioredoxin-related protein